MNYTAESIEVLSGLDPVRKRPGMYTDTTRPNHLAQEIIDNSIDEALAGFANEITVTIYEDGSLTVTDNGRGMPTDVHPEYGISGVELILTRLHAGGKFSNKSYQFSGGLHGVGVSVVNALSSSLKATIWRNGQVQTIAFNNGHKSSELTVIDRCAKKRTGTSVWFLPNAKYFDSAKFSVVHLKHILRAKALLCPGLTVIFKGISAEHDEQWCYQDGLTDYLKEHTQNDGTVPSCPFVGQFQSKVGAVDWAVCWLAEPGELLQESYVNLIPTIQGGTHVNGFRSGLLDALREFCEFRHLLPKGLKLVSDDIWGRCVYVLSAKLLDPQFSGQTKERLSSREAASFISHIVKDAFALWLNEHTNDAELLADLAISSAQQRLRKAKKIARKKIAQGPALPGKLTDCSSQDVDYTELFLVEGDSAGGSAKQARNRQYQAIMPLRGKILNTWEIDSNEILASQEVHDIAVALGIDPGQTNLAQLRYGKICILADADSDGLHIATLLCALFLRHFKPLVSAGHVYVAMPPLYRIDVGKEVFYALDDDEKSRIIKRIHNEKKRGKINVQRFKGLGEMNPLQLRETTMDPNARRLVQLSLEENDGTFEKIDRLLAKKRASDRRQWLELSGDSIAIVV